jgi:hypothetical protein
MNTMTTTTTTRKAMTIAMDITTMKKSTAHTVQTATTTTSIR